MRKQTYLFIASLVALGVFFGLQAWAAIPLQLQIGLPGFGAANQTIFIDNDSIGSYIIAVYTFSVYAGGVLSAIVLMIGGFLWLTAAGNTSRIEQAKTHIGGALSGYVLLLLSWVLLNTINPNLVRFNELRIPTVVREPRTAVVQGCNNYQERPADTPFFFYDGPVDADQYCGGEVAGTNCYCERPLPGTFTCCVRQTTNPACPGYGICFNVEALIVPQDGETCPEGTTAYLHPPDFDSCEEAVSAFSGNTIPECSSCTP
ncbi:hypothetical protein COV04_00220 [Candidatus Uhrbacteria bacterium CG10_big_fil_rev_8_21_14_0_10_48_11]|uniref:Uncharacterized protein n=1 Tax=Candidatus Uhrbacteria bacterium CG10_big_fil_rev_8_21_14_0_10_48_11 TaxID=1975037 RepID=A0A2M8LFR0_9BACT|nr:MAG: hypothetical protein COV04_00220 [Candidatus Uhrbacteria bacterium CG10_big_fil_rev_8_21_14_0_10_48_11]